MTIEEMYSNARAAELRWDTHNSRHLEELRRLEAADAERRGEERSRQALARLRRSAG